MSWRDGQLFIALYAADEDIRAATARHDDPLWLTDAFQLSFTYAGREHVLDIFRVGVVTDGERPLPDGKVDFRWESEALVGHEEDGH